MYTNTKHINEEQNTHQQIPMLPSVSATTPATSLKKKERKLSQHFKVCNSSTDEGKSEKERP